MLASELLVCESTLFSLLEQPSPNIQAINFSLQKRTSPVRSRYVGLCEKNDSRSDMDTRRNDERKLSINNTTAINVFKAYTELGSHVFGK